MEVSANNQSGEMDSLLRVINAIASNLDQNPSNAQLYQQATVAHSNLEAAITRVKRHFDDTVGNNQQVGPNDDKDNTRKKFRANSPVGRENDHENNEIQVFEQRSDKKSPQETVFYNDLLREKIIKLCNGNDLFSLRRVHSRCNSYRFVDKLLLKRDFSMSHIYSNDSRKYLLWDAPKLAFLEHLTNFLDACPIVSLPCTKFGFHNGSLDSPDLQAFLDAYGVNITHLDIHMFCNDNMGDSSPPNIVLLQRLLKSQIPNVEELTIFSWPITWLGEQSSYQLFPENLSKHPSKYLNALKTFTLSYSPSPFALPLLKQILDEAPNLEAFEWSATMEQNIYYLEFVLEHNKTHLVKQLDLRYFRATDEVYDVFAEANPQLTHLFMYEINDAIVTDENVEFLTAVTAITNKILRSSTNSLNFLLLSPFGLLEDLDIPPMLNLTHLLLRASDPPPVGILSLFPPGFSFSKSFPSVKKLEFSFDVKHIGQFYSWKTFFNIPDPFKEMITTVRHLEFEFEPPTCWIFYLSIMLPNVRIFKCGNVSEISPFMHYLCQFENLEKIDIEIDVSYSCVSNRFPAIDAAFTGIQTKYMYKLHRNPKLLDMTTVNELRIKRSFVDLQRLRELKIKLVDNSSMALYWGPIISHVSGIFAFQLLPKVQVKMQIGGNPDIMYGLWIATSHIIPYVHSFSESYSGDDG